MSEDRRSRLRLTSLEGRCAPADLPAGFVESELVGGLNRPTALAAADDGRLFIAEQAGRVRVVKGGELLDEPFVETDGGDFFGERGLLGLALHPDFAASPFVYTYHTVAAGDANVVTRWRADGDVAAAGPGEVLIEVPGGANHNGGALHFGPDGKLYVAVGDTNEPLASQDLAALTGSILRLNDDGSVPADNPFGTEVWAHGLRNPFSFSIDPVTGRLLAADVGQSGWEEINDVRRGGNYGWPVAEGPSDDPAFAPPLYAYPHEEQPGGLAAVIGGTFYRPPVANFPEEFEGKYFFADYQRLFLHALDPETGEAEHFADGLAAPVDFDVGPDGSLYYVNFGNVIEYGRGTYEAGSGKVVRIAFDADGPPRFLTHPLDAVAANGESAVFTVEGSAPGEFTYRWQRDGEDIPGETGPVLELDGVTPDDSGAAFRAAVTNEAGEAFSRPATLTVTPGRRPVIEFESPREGARFIAGVAYDFAAEVTDPDTGPLTGDAASYEVSYYTGGWPRPFLGPVTGSASGVLDVPGRTPFKTTDVFYRITVTATDEEGLTATATRDVHPVTAAMTIKGDVPGAVRLDGEPLETPSSVGGVAGVVRDLEAALEVAYGGRFYRFAGWDDGGRRVREFAWPRQDRVLRARYEPVGGPRRVDAAPVAVGDSSSARLMIGRVASVDVTPFGDFAGGVRVAAADFTGDGVPDLAAAAGPGGGPAIALYDGSDGSELGRWFAFEPTFTGGVHLAAGDFDGDGVAELIAGAGAGGGPRVTVFDVEGGALADVFAFEPSFAGGVTVAAGDVDGDGTDDLAVGAGAGGGPRVAVFAGGSVIGGDPDRLFGDRFLFEAEYRGGSRVALGDIDVDGSADLIAGPADAGGPRVAVLSGRLMLGRLPAEMAAFFAADPESRGGLALAARDVDGDGQADVIAGGDFGVRVAHSGRVESGDAGDLTEYLPPGETGVFVG